MDCDDRADGILAPNLDRLARELTVQEAVLAYTWRSAAGSSPPTTASTWRTTKTIRCARRCGRCAASSTSSTADSSEAPARRPRHQGRAGGYAFGAPPFGKQAVDNKLVDLDPEKEIEDLILKWHDEERLGARAICRRLNEQGKLSKRGGKWHPTTVAGSSTRPRARQPGALGFDRAQKKEETRRTRARRSWAAACADPTRRPPAARHGAAAVPSLLVDHDHGRRGAPVPTRPCIGVGAVDELMCEIAQARDPRVVSPRYR
ncbi:hypothetical protein F3K43_47345 [Streptomyces sp. LBUM 1476]|nr:hypothetical protein [Streptomyces sp. LBUM 1476]